MAIRQLATEDLTGAMALVLAVFMEFEAPDYSAQGIAEFKRYIETKTMRVRMETGDLTLWGYYEGDRITGLIASRRGEHISLLFVHRDFHRRGIATQLFEAALAAFPNISAVTVNASPYGYEAYRRMGFEDTGPEQTVNGLTFIPMVYRRKMRP